MRACAAMGVVVTHVAFQTGHSSGVGGRLFGRFDLAVAVFFALSGFLLWRGHAAAARGHRGPAADGSLPAVAGGAHHAGLPRGGGRHPVAAARRRPRQPDRVAGQPDAHPDLRAAHPDRRPDPDVEPVGRGHLLPGPAGPGAAGPPPPRRRARAGDRRAGRPQLGLGLGADGNRLRGQPAELAAGVLLVVRRGHAAGRVGPHADRGAAPGGPPAARDGRRRAALAFLVAASPLAGPEGLVPGTATQFAVKTAAGSLVCVRAGRAAGAGPAGHAAPGAGRRRSW